MLADTHVVQLKSFVTDDCPPGRLASAASARDVNCRVVLSARAFVKCPQAYSDFPLNAAFRKCHGLPLTSLAVHSHLDPSFLKSPRIFDANEQGAIVAPKFRFK